MTNDTSIAEQAPVGAKDPAQVLAESGIMQNEAALEGLAELLDKLAPLLAGRRLNRVVDALSLVADLVDMSDAYMVEKLAKAYEEAIGSAWTVGNAARAASTRVSAMKEAPSLMGLYRMTREPEVRRGLALALAFGGVLGQLSEFDPTDPCEE